MIRFVRCWTGRRWIDLGRGAFAIGFGPRRLVERVWIARRMVYPTIDREARAAMK